MKAAIFEEFKQPLSIQNVADPSPDDDGVVIRVEANGICRSDWHGWMGHDPDVTLPHVPGHELAGVIEAVGKRVKNWKIGDRVTVPFSCGCGSCPQCSSGYQNICDQYFQPGFTGWGSFAQYVAIKYAETNLIRVPNEIKFTTASILGCRFITSFRAVVAQGKVSAGQWVCIHGCGGIGLSAIMIARALGAQVIAVDIDPQKLVLAQSVGASYGLNAHNNPHLIQEIMDITGSGAHVSIDALGSITTCRNSLLSLRKRGKHIQVGLMVADDSDAPLPLAPVIGKELEIIGSHGMQAHYYPQMLTMIMYEKLNPHLLIGKTISLEEAPDVLQNMNSFPQVGMIVIDRF